MSISSQLHAVLTDESHSFEQLLRIAGLNPGCDLRGCDFTDVDFGSLEADHIDLTMCDLTGADLRQVRGRLTLAGAILLNTQLPDDAEASKSQSRTEIKVRFSLLKRVLLSAHRFYLPSRVALRIRQHIDQRNPIITCYRSHTEHELVADSIRKALSAFLDELISEYFYQRSSPKSVRLIEISSNSTPARVPADDGFRLDATFFKSLEGSRLEDVLHKSVDAGSALTRIYDHFRHNSRYSSPALQHLSSYGSDVEKVRVGRGRLAQSLNDYARHGLNIFFLNGTSLMSQSMLETLQRSVPNSRFVWLVSSNIFYNDMPKMSDILPRYVSIAPTDTVTQADAAAFLQRFENYKKFGLTLTDETKVEIMGYVGRSVSDLKNMFIGKVMTAAASRKMEGGSVTI